MLSKRRFKIIHRIAIGNNRDKVLESKYMYKPMVKDNKTCIIQLSKSLVIHVHVKLSG